jgi:hypothetical protein
MKFNGRQREIAFVSEGQFFRQAENWVNGTVNITDEDGNEVFLQDTLGCNVLCLGQVGLWEDHFLQMGWFNYECRIRWLQCMILEKRQETSQPTRETGFTRQRQICGT